MPEKYLYKDKVLQRKDVEDAAKQSGMDINTYTQKAGLKVVNDNYNFNGKTIPAEEIFEAAKQSGLGFDDYIQKAKITALPDEKKKLVGKVDFGESSLQAGNDLSQSSGVGGEEIPTIEMYKAGEELVPTDPISLSQKYNELSNKTIEHRTGGEGTVSQYYPDEEAKKTAQKLKEDFKDIDLGGIYEETKDLHPDIIANHGKRLMQERNENPQLYQRDLSNIKWRSGFEKQLLNEVDRGAIDPDNYNRIKHSIDTLPEFAGQGDFSNQRTAIQSLSKDIQEYGGENKDELLKNFAIEVSKVYGNAYNNNLENALKDTPESKYLNNDEQLGLQYLKDVAPDKAAQYDRLMIDPKTIKDNPDAVKGYNHLKQTLEETGLGLQQNSINEELNSLKKQAEQNGGLSEEQLTKADQLEKKNEELAQKRTELDKKYPERLVNKVDDAMQEIFGQKLSFGEYAIGKTLEAGKNTVQGIWEGVSTPFMSKENTNMRELAIMGDQLGAEKLFHKTDKNKNLLTDELVIQPELQTQIDAVKNDKSLSEDNKKTKIKELLQNNTDKFGRVPIQNGKFNINPSSILYGVTDLGTALLPFIGIEAATGGIGGGGAAVKFLRTFTAAAATTFHDEYAAAIMEGKTQSDAYRTAMSSTAINSLAMAGAGTPADIRKMASGMKTSASKIIAQMSDKEIQNVLSKGTPKGLKAFGQSFKERIKATPQMALQGVKTGTKFEAAMAGADYLNDREHNWKQSVLGIANFGLIGAGLGHIGYKSPTELQKSGLLEMGKNAESFHSTLDEMKKNGQLNEAEYEHRKDLIDKASEAYKILPKANAKGKPLTENEKSEYLYNAVIKNEGNKSKVNLPPKQAEKAEITAMAADHANDLILDPKTDKQLEDRKSALEKSLEKKDENGKLELTDTERKDATAELQAVNDAIERSKNNVVVEPPKEIPESIPLEENKTFVEEPRNIPEPIPLINEESQTEIHKPTEVKSTTNIKPTEAAPEAETGEEGQAVGIRHESLKKIADRLGLKQPERGTFLTPEEQLKRGKALLDAGADPQKVADDFKKEGKVDADSISVARAHFVTLTKIAQKALDEHGKDSPEFKKAQEDMQKWQDEVVKPMGTASGGAFSALQGEEDLDTGSFISLKNAFKEQFGKDPNPKQEKAIKDLSEKVKGLSKQVEDLKTKLTEALDKIAKEGKGGKSSKEKSEKTADRINKIADNIEKFGKAKGAEGAVKSGFSPDIQKMVANAMRVVAEGVRQGKSIPKAILDAVKQYANDKLDAIGLRDAIHEGLKEAGIDEKEFDILTKFVDKKDNEFSPEDAKQIWEYAKEEYLDKGESYVDMIGGVSKDLGLSGEQVRRAITSPKEVRKISDEIYKRNQQRTDAINQAKVWLKNADNSKLKNFLKAIPNTFFRIKTFGHGTVGAITHAAPHLFQPSKWKLYFPFWVKQFKYAFGSTANYNKAMEDLKNDKDFIFWKRNGLAVDPKEKYDDYQGNFADKKSNNKIVKFFNRAGVAGDRGFNALKVYRLSLAKFYYDKLSVSEKADPETAPRIAELVNHGTGTTEVKTPRWSNTVFFAPKLEISRWQRLITDPLKALHTVKRLSLGQNVDASDKMAAKRVAKNAGETVATYVSLLAMNSAILALTGSKQKINYTNPLDNDWLKPKVGGTSVDASGGMLATMRFIASIAEAAENAYTGSKKDLKEKPQESDYKKIGQQARYKLSPFMSTLVDWATGTDAMGRPIPFSNVPPRAGEEKYKIGEYLFHQQTPIPVAEYFKEVANSMKDRGMSSAQVNDVLKGILVGVLSGGTGMKVMDEEDKTGITDKKSEVHNFLESKESGIKPFRKEGLQPVDENGKDIKVTEEDYKKFLAEREKIIAKSVQDLLKGGGIYEDEQGIPHEISAKEAKNITKEELDSYLMTQTTRADKEAMQTIFNGSQKEEPKTKRKIEVWQ